MPPRMTSVALERGFQNAIICGIGVLGVTGILTFGIKALTGRTFRDSGAIAFAIFWVVIFAAFVLAFFIGRMKRGEILLDCGQHPAKALFLFNAVVFAFIGLGGGFASKGNDTIGITSALFGLTFSAYWVLICFGRLQIVENGIWQYWNLLKWQKIEAYEWKGNANSTLMLQAKTKIPFLGRGALPVPTEYKEAVSELLEKHAAQKKAEP
jgi:hypothetical protein